MKKISKQPLEVVYGIHPIEELIEAGRRRVRTLYTVKPSPKSVRMLIERAPRVQYVDRVKLNRMAGTSDHQSVVALADPFPFAKRPFTSREHPCIVLLDGIQDPRNVGAIIRSAYCTGMDGIVLPIKGSSGLTATVLKASAGLAERLSIFQPRSTEQAISQIEQAGYQIWYGGLEGESLVNAEMSKPVCIVIGSEGAGVSTAVRGVGRAVHIPQRAADVSYNASVAAGILLFYLSARFDLL